MSNQQGKSVMVRLSVWQHADGRLALMPGRVGTSPCDQPDGHGEPCACGWSRRLSGYVNEGRVITSDDPHDDRAIYSRKTP